MVYLAATSCVKAATVRKQWRAESVLPEVRASDLSLNLRGATLTLTLHRATLRMSGEILNNDPFFSLDLVQEDPS